MRQVKKLLFSILLMLALEAVKRFFLDRTAVSYSFFYNLLSCLQLAILIWAVISLLFKNLLFSLIAFFALSILLEVICATLLSNPEYIPKPLMKVFSFYYHRFDCRFIQYEPSMARYDGNLFYKLKETNQFVYSNAEFADSFYVNSLGFRDDEISLERPEIICAGDSYTLGWGVKQNETFAQLIEKESGLKVLNASMSSYGTARESVAMKKIDPSGIKFIIWQYAPNDADENNAYIDSSYNYSAPSEKQYSSTQQTHLWATKYFPGKHFLTLTKLFAGSLVRKSYEEWKKSSLSPRDEAKNFLDILKNTGINPRVKLIVFELSNYQMKNEFTNELKLLLRNDYAKSILQNIQVLDFSTLLKKEDYYLLDDHINESGHKKIAEVLLNAVKKSAD